MRMLKEAATVAAAVIQLSCGDDALSLGRESGSPAPSACFQDSDCGSALRCLDFRCVAGDGLPPEQEDTRTFLRPAASVRHVFVLSPESDSVAVIDPTTLAIEAVLVPDEPFDLAVAPGQDAAIILSRQGAAVSVLSMTPAGPRLHTQRTARKYPAVDVSPDGRWAILWTPDGNVPDAGAEGIVAVVDIAAIAAGAPAAILERAAGRRHTHVFFRQSGAASADAVLVGKEEIAVIDLRDAASEPVPDRVALPAQYTETTAREAVAPPDGSVVMVRSIAFNEVAIFDVASRTLGRLALSGPPSDLDLSEDGRLAVAALRESSEVVWFPVPAALTNPSLIRTARVVLPAHGCPVSVPCSAAPGQVVIAPGGLAAALFTNARATESLGWLDLATGGLTVFAGLEKVVDTLGIARDGFTAVVLHRPEPGSTVADTYERSVDQAQGYSVVDLRRGIAQLKLTGDVPPLEFVFSADGRHAGVTLRDDARRIFRIDAIDLSTLITTTLSLASAPQYAGPFAGGARDPRVWVTQKHPAGRISFVDLAARAVRTATGYELNADIE